MSYNPFVIDACRGVALAPVLHSRATAEDGRMSFVVKKILKTCTACPIIQVLCEEEQTNAN